MTRTAKHAICTATAMLWAAPAAAAPASFEQAVEIVGSARHAVDALPVLTGTEAFDVEVFRQSLRDRLGDSVYADFMTAEDVVNLVRTAGTTSEQFMTFHVGWAALDVNWLLAALLGDKAAADRLATESVTLSGQHAWYLQNVLQGNSIAFANVFATRIEAAQLAMILRVRAADVDLAAYVPDAIDPEGYLRQRLRSMFDRLTNAADFIRDAGQAHEIYY